MTTRKKSDDADSETTTEANNTTPETNDPTAEMTFPRSVRTTFRPDTDVEVDRAEYTNLKVQGVLIEGTENKES